MRVVLFVCDWCGAQAKPLDVVDETWPKGWTTLDGHGDELLCVACLEAVTQAIAETKATRLCSKEQEK